MSYSGSKSLLKYSYKNYIAKGERDKETNFREKLHLVAQIAWHL